MNIQNSTKPLPKPKTYASARNHKRLKMVHSDDVTTAPITIADRLQEYLETNCLSVGNSDDFNVIQYWLDRYKSQPDLTQFALDILTIPPILDKCERLFSSCKILLEDRRSRLQIDIIEANKCLRHWYGPPRKGTFNDTDVGVTEGEPTPQMVSPKEALKARVAAYQKAMEEAIKAVVEAAVNAAANVAAEAAPKEPGGPGELVVIEPDEGENESHDEDAYAAFEESIEVEDYEASYLEAL